MDITIGSLKVGTPLILGKYGVRNDNPQNIVWLKASPNCDFISRDVVDLLMFDGNERDGTHHRYTGNENYALSNLHSFINSEQEDWYYPKHENDEPPCGRYSAYNNHFGFLYHFEEYELKSICYVTQNIDGDDVSGYIRLPRSSDIIGEDKFPVFRKKGIRPNLAEDAVNHRRGHALSYESYAPFYLSDRHGGAQSGYVKCIGRDGRTSGVYASSVCGLRPVCTIDQNAQVIFGGDGIYRIKPMNPQRIVYTDEDLFNLLGIAP